jgi:hypothetical protein
MDKRSDIRDRWDHELAAPLGRVASGRLVIGPRAARLTVRGDPTMADLYRASFESPPPTVTVRGAPSASGTAVWRGSAILALCSARRRAAG